MVARQEASTSARVFRAVLHDEATAGDGDGALASPLTSRACRGSTVGWIEVAISVRREVPSSGRKPFFFLIVPGPAPEGPGGRVGLRRVSIGFARWRSLLYPSGCVVDSDRAQHVPRNRRRRGSRTPAFDRALRDAAEAEARRSPRPCCRGAGRDDGNVVRLRADLKHLPAMDGLGVLRRVRQQSTA